MDMRGLSVFISEIRKCTTKEQEQKRVDKELAKIRGKFKTSGMKGYDRKKYVCKLLYIYMLGYEIDFGHIEAVNLLSSEKYSEKHTGYLACTLLLHENHELVTLITNCIKRDLNNKNSYDEQCLGLTALANIGGKEQAEALAADVQKLLVSADTRLIVRKKAALTLLNMYRKYPELLPPDQWSARIMSLLANKDLGVITSVMSLLLGFVAADPTPYVEAVPKIIRLLGKFANIREIPPNYLYYGIVAPWLQVKCLRLLQYYDAPTDPTLTQAVGQVIQRAFAAAERAKQMDKSKSVSRTNAAHAVLFESMNVLIQYDNDEQQLINAANLLGRYLQDKDPNLRYLALDTMSRLAYTSHKEVKASIRKHQMTVLLALKDPDISIRRRALDLLYHMCNHSNASQIVGELLEYLPLSNYEIREELVLKVAILAERFAQDFTWYVEVILNLITQAGDFVSEEIWHRVVQIVTNRDEALQKDTADRVFRVVAAPASHENSVKVAGYILGEYGHLIGDREETSGNKQFDVLNHKFDLVSINTKALLLNAYIKFYHVYEDAELRGKIKQVFEQHRNFIDAELQQRANEYFNLANSNDSKLMGDTLAAIPPFPERESSVMKKILERQTQSRAVRVDKQPQQQQEEEEVEETEQEEVAQAPAPAKEHNLLEELDSAPEAKPAPSSGGLLDLDDLLGAPAPTPAPVAARTVQPQPASIDPFFSEPNLAQSAAATAAAKAKQREAQGVSIDDMIASNKQEDAEMSKTVHADAEQKYKQLVITNSGTAIEDQHLAVKIQSEFHGSKGRIVLAYGNKTDYPISKVRADLTSAPQVDVQPSQVPPLIAAKSQAQQYLSIDCLMPFSDSIYLSLYFEFERKTYKFHVKLPIVPHKFIEPQQLNGSQAFFSKWNSIQKGAPLEIQDIVKPQNPVNPERAKSLFSTGFRFALLGGVDPNPNNIVASGVFHSQQGQQDVLVRLETNSNVNAYRLTIRSTNAVVSTQVFASLKAALLDL